MDKEELKELLKKNLVLKLHEEYSAGKKYIIAEIRFDEDVISKSEVAIGPRNLLM